MAKVQEDLTGDGAGQKKAKPRTTRLISFWVTQDVFKEIGAQAAQEQLNVSDYARARVHGHGVRDRSMMAAIAGLHVAGRALIDISQTLKPREGHEHEEVIQLVAEMRRLTSVLAERLG